MAEEEAKHRPIAQTVLQLATQMAAGGYKAAEIGAVLVSYQASARLYAGIYRESGKTLIDHAVGTASVVTAHGAPADVVSAALLHAAYPLGFFPTFVANDVTAKRRWLEANTSAAVEEQVWDYACLDFETV